MTNLLSNFSGNTTASLSKGYDRLVPTPIVQQRVAWAVLALAACTIGLMALGSATRVMNAGLSCPDWPLCYGEFVPSTQMNLQVFLEWFHRLVATSVGFGILILSATVVGLRKQLPKWLPWGMGLALFLVMFQGVLGGLTVTELLRFDIVTAHLGTGLAFFSTLLVIGLSLLDYRPEQLGAHTSAYPLRWLAGIAAGLVYVQSILGGLVASQWAVHQCFGKAQLCGVMNRHIFGVVPATIAIVGVLGWALWIQAKTNLKLPLLIRRCLIAIALLLSVQIALGVTTFRLHLQVEVLTVLHQAVGAALLGTLLATAVFALREPQPTNASAQLN